MGSLQKVLVTGGFGYVGSRLTPLLADQGYDVRVLDLGLYGDFGYQALTLEQRQKVDWHKADLRDPVAVKKACEGRQAVIHLAAISNDPTGDVDEVLTRQTNFDAVGQLLAIAKEAGVERFINASSSSVFGMRSESNINEMLEPEPITYYSKYKMLSEWLVVSANAPGFCTVNIRPATICGYSPRQRFDLTVNKLTADGVTKRVITVHGGEQRRPNVGMTDMVNLYAQLLKTDASLIAGRTFNFGFENLKVIEIARLIQSELKEMNVDLKVTDTHDNRDYHISSSKILDVLKYKPVSSIALEVANLKAALDSGKFKDVDAPEHYNMKSMVLSRQSTAYNFLSR